MIRHYVNINGIDVEADYSEENYLLLNEDGWRGLSYLADYTISLKADPELLHKRLLDRKIASGSSYEDALSHVDFSDMRNVTLCLEKTKKADLELQVTLNPISGCHELAVCTPS